MLEKNIFIKLIGIGQIIFRFEITNNKELKKAKIATYYVAIFAYINLISNQSLLK